jgi:predicted GNAT family acetyltransferase
VGAFRLGPEHLDAATTLLAADTIQNLFLLGFLDGASLGRGLWYGVERDSALVAVAVVVPDRLAVPWAPDPADAAVIGRKLRHEQAPTMIVGPRLASDALWDAWTQRRIEPDRFYDQRLYVCREAPVVDYVEGFRKAIASDWEVAAQNSARMEYEDTGRDPSVVDPDTHEHVVRERIRNGKTWVIARDGRIVFQINVGTSSKYGCQVGGTWVPPDLRGAGLATIGMKALCQRLLVDHPFVTLHVNEANLPAVKVYEKSGFVRGSAYRLLTVRTTGDVT